MGSAEFALHQAYLALTDGPPDAATQRWAQLMAATLNGPLRRKDKRRFKAEDFWPADPWAAHEDAPVRPKGKVTRATMMAPDFSHLRGMTVRGR